MKHIILHIETQKTFSEIKDRSKLWDLKMSTAVTYQYENDKYKFWTYTNQGDLLDYLNNNFVIGYNTIMFDCPIISGENHKIENIDSVIDDKYRWTNYDILHEIKKKIFGVPSDYTLDKTLEVFRKNFGTLPKGTLNLENVVIATLNKHKNSKKVDNVELFKTKKILDLIQSNLHTTRIIKQLYDFILKNKYLITGSYDVCLMG